MRVPSLTELARPSATLLGAAMPGFPLPALRGYSTAINCTSKISVALCGIAGGYPSSP